MKNAIWIPALLGLIFFLLKYSISHDWLTRSGISIAPKCVLNGAKIEQSTTVDSLTFTCDTFTEPDECYLFKIKVLSQRPFLQNQVYQANLTPFFNKGKVIDSMNIPSSQEVWYQSAGESE